MNCLHAVQRIRGRSGKIIAGATVVGAATVAAYMLAIRPWHLNWGAAEEEIHSRMPLDEKIQSPTYVTNRAITIEARPEEVWHWLVQMGELPRGGFYSYEWIERLLGMVVANAEQILPDFQHLQAGDVLDRSGKMQVKAVEPNRHLVLGPPEGLGFGESTWALVLSPLDSKRTRLISRVRARINLRAAQGIFWLVLLDPGQFVMERKMLLEIKRRAEAAIQPPKPSLQAGETHR